jgi:hypothetical protein
LSYDIFQEKVHTYRLTGHFSNTDLRDVVDI